MIVRSTLILCSIALVLSLTVFAQAPSYDALIQQGNAQLQAGSNNQALATANAAIKVDTNRWEAYALAGGALMNLKRHEEAADDFSKAIERAPATKQDGLRELRRKCFAAESGPASAPTSAAGASEPAVTTTQAEIVLWKSIENSTNPENFQTYLSQYPQGAFSRLAQQHLKDIDEQLAAAKKAQEEKTARERQAGVWTDPATSMMWTVRDNGSDINWKTATSYCKKLALAGFSDWRLPTIDQLQQIYDPEAKVSEPGFALPAHIKGNLVTSSTEWNSTVEGPGRPWVFSFLSGHRHQIDFSIKPGLQAFCVRRVNE